MLRNEELFRIEKGTYRPYETIPEIVMKLTFEHHLDRFVTQRSNYTFLGVLSDVGGLSAVIYSVFATLLAILNYNSLNAHIVNKLFKFSDSDPESNQGNLYRPSKLANIVGLFMSFLPSCCMRCKKPHRIQ